MTLGLCYFIEGIDTFNIGGRDRMVVGFITTCAISVYPTNIVSSNPTQARCTRYIMRQVDAFLRVLQFHPPIKLTTMI
jgi:hypothetical protein